MKTIRQDIYNKFVHSKIILTSKRGQNYLKNKEILDFIASQTKLLLSSNIVEIGTGPGILTEPLALTGKNIISFELDKGVYEIVNILQKDYKNLTIINKDFLKTDMVLEDFAVVANIPYNITSDIIKKIFTEYNPECAILMVQKEFAQKIITGNPVNSQTVFMKNCFEIESLKQVSKNDFFPPPKVNSTLIKITPLYEKTFLQPFYTFLKDIFSFRNKNLSAFYKKNNLNSKYNDLMKKKIQNLEYREFLSLFKEKGVKPVHNS
ncbi:MAG: rRNA adenine N(6)-methyltransferase family protein [Candidatus Muirbacterium halophilum]|nr:rRNA adenine N(6)-methyltransferase family protein [Candidatus Muirbacterium halophilum]